MIYQSYDQKTPTLEANARPYNSPRLLVYGAVRELTAGGSGQSDEGSMTGDLTRRP